MSTSVKVSVLTALYNHKAEYVRQCLESLHQQKWQEIEFILIDDNSNADNKALIDEYLAKDTRFRAIRFAQNGGYGRALNAGIKSAQGQYMGILESDDFVDQGIYHDLYHIAEKNECDIVKCDWISYYENDPKKNLRRYNFPKDICGRVLKPADHPSLFTADPSIWCALYKLHFIKQNNLYFTESSSASYQDLSFNFRALALASKACFLDRAYVHYRRDNANSSVKNATSSQIYRLINEFHNIDNFLDEHHDLRKKLICVKNYIKSRSYRWNYLRAQGEAKADALACYKSEFEESFHRRELDRSFFKDDEADFLADIIGVSHIGRYDNENINICFSFDAHYYFPAQVAISSLLDKASSAIGYNFYLLVKKDVNPQMRKELRSFIQHKSPLSQVAYIRQKNLFDKSFETRGISNSTYFKLMLHRILPDVDSIIYSDVDVLFNSDLSEFKNIPLTDYLLAAVKDICLNQKKNWNNVTKELPYFNQLNIGKYRNAGFLVLNLNKIRTLHWDDEVLKLSQMELRFQDQDILNILLSKHAGPVLHLPPKYISMPKHWELGNYKIALQENIITKQEYSDVIKAPAIYHYPGAVKPWSHPAEAYNKKWVKYVKNSKLLREQYYRIYSIHPLKNIFYKKSVDNGFTLRSILWGLISTKKKVNYCKWRFLGISLFSINQLSANKRIIKICGLPLSQKTRVKKG